MSTEGSASVDASPKNVQRGSRRIPARIWLTSSARRGEPVPRSCSGDLDAVVADDAIHCHCLEVAADETDRGSVEVPTQVATRMLHQ